MSWYLPRTEQGKKWQTMGYWFAVGIHYAGGVPDMSSEFGQFAARNADAYELGETTVLYSLLDQWAAFQRQKGIT